MYVVEGGVSFLGTEGKISFACLMHCEGPINRNRRLTMCPLPSVFFLWKLVRPVCSGFFTILLKFDKNFVKPWFKGFLFSKFNRNRRLTICPLSSVFFMETG